jgi:Xaa-Pro aminopeptidase
LKPSFQIKRIIEYLRYKKEHPMKNKRQKTILLLAVWTAISFTALLRAQIPDKSVFAMRREKLMKQMDGGIAVFRNTSVQRRNGDEDYPYRTDSDFYYLSGFPYADAVFILIPDAEKSFILFVEPKSYTASQWFGDLPGIEGAMETFGADTAYAIGTFEDALPNWIMNKKRVYCDLENDSLCGILRSSLRRLGTKNSTEIVNVMPLLHELRIFKRPEEIRLLQKAVDITGEALIEVMKAAHPSMYEYELDAILDYVFRKNGSPRKGFGSIVGSGPKSTVFNYQTNDRLTENGDMVILDVGAEYGYYTADITRTIPVNGKFAPKQREIYGIVFEAQEAAIRDMIPGNPCFQTAKTAEKIVKEGLYRLGLITDPESVWQHWLYYYPFISHPLGLDVHDVGDFGNFWQGGRNLEPGMVLTIEPGIYIGDNLIPAFRNSAMKYFKATAEEVDAFLEKIRPVFDAYKPLGVRIEDDILITEKGNENLSAKVVRTVEDIEKKMMEKSDLNK